MSLFIRGKEAFHEDHSYSICYFLLSTLPDVNQIHQRKSMGLFENALVVIRLHTCAHQTAQREIVRLMFSQTSTYVRASTMPNSLATTSSSKIIKRKKLLSSVRQSICALWAQMFAFHHAWKACPPGLSHTNNGRTYLHVLVWRSAQVSKNGL